MSDKYEHNERLAKWLNNDLDQEDTDALRDDRSLDELRFVINDIDSWSLPKPDVEKKLQQLKESVGQKETKVIQFTPKIWLRYAAAIALIVTGYFAGKDLLMNPNIIVETALGEQLSHELPDGSIVTLGPSSRLEYKRKNWMENRTSSLVGEGFFDVQSGPGFSVTTSKGTISVLGTEFDIEIEGERLEVNCYEGRVLVDMASQDEILQAQQGLILQGSSVDRSQFTAMAPHWIGEKSSFEDTYLSAVVFELKKYYKLDLQLPKKYQTTSFTGSFVHDNLEEALKSIFTPLEISYTLKEGGKVEFE